MKGLFPSDKQEIILDVTTREFIAEFKKQVQVSYFFHFLRTGNQAGSMGKRVSSKK